MRRGNLFHDAWQAFHHFMERRSATTIGLSHDEQGRVHANTSWQPTPAPHRVEILVTGDPSRVGTVADAVDDLQKKFFGDAARPKNLEVRITAFLDNCTHRTGWHKKPFKAAAQARAWRCKQSPTKISAAFEESTGEMVDSFVIIGHRFDDDAKQALHYAEVLKEQGVHIHCFHTGQDEASKAVFEKLAEKTDGVFLELTDQSAIAEVIPIIMAHLNDAHSLEALAPKDETARRLVHRLTPDGVIKT